MAEKDKNSEEHSEKRSKVKGYEELIGRLKKEREELQNEINKDYREARRYVRSHPEEGVIYAFVGGVALGYILGKLGSK